MVFHYVIGVQLEEIMATPTKEHKLIYFLLKDICFLLLEL
jgi:hypothetical protein